MHVNIPYHNCIYNRLPEEEHPGSKHVEYIKITYLNIDLEKREIRWFILCNYKDNIKVYISSDVKFILLCILVFLNFNSS
jgi:hypothetical protein